MKEPTNISANSLFVSSFKTDNGISEYFFLQDFCSIYGMLSLLLYCTILVCRESQNVLFVKQFLNRLKLSHASWKIFIDM